MELYEFYISLCLTWRLYCDYYLGQFRPITDLSCWQKHVSLYHVLGPMLCAVVTSDNDFFRACYGTLWNFLMCLMERNNYASHSFCPWRRMQIRHFHYRIWTMCTWQNVVVANCGPQPLHDGEYTEEWDALLQQQVVTSGVAGRGGSRGPDPPPLSCPVGSMQNVKIRW